MNAKQRKKLMECKAKIQGVMLDIEAIRDEEQEKLDNTPENLQGGEKYSMMEDSLYIIESLLLDMESVTDQLDEAVETA